MPNLSAVNEVRLKKDIATYQIKQIFGLFVAGLGVLLITLLFPDFLGYHYLHWGGWESVWRFWPMFAWCVSIATISCLFDNNVIRKNDNHLILRYSIWTSMVAGIWEELGFRWIFVYYAAILLMFFNWVFGAGIGLVLAATFVLGTIISVADRKFLSAAGFVVGTGLAVLFALYVNFFYWMYGLFVWIIHFTTFFQMDSVLYSAENTQLFIFGAILANAWFRDGHKYQGLFGIINSWYAGMVLLYATVTYGLLTAIVIHALYDVLVSVIKFVFRKMEK